MTGFGEAQHQDQGLAITVELRTINNRYFKFSLRLPPKVTVYSSRRSKG